MIRNLKILFFAGIIFMICGAPTIRFQAVRPAWVNIPQHIRAIGVIDRSERPKTTASTIEKVITAELPGEGKIAAQIAIDGFADFLRNSDRFEVVRSNISVKKEGSANSFPEPLSWNEIEAFCKELNVDGIIALEVFNSDYIIPTSMVIVNAGFRFYDVAQKKIIDQELFRHEIFWNRQVSTGIQALERIMDKDRAIKEASYQAGGRYGQRIVPSWFTIAREYYHKPKRNAHLSMGARMMEVNDWDAAIESLSKAIETGKRKSQGRASHNLAIVYEILGDLEAAKSHAGNAWGMYRNKGSKNYSYILGQRISEQRVLNAQEGN